MAIIIRILGGCVIASGLPNLFHFDCYEMLFNYIEFLINTKHMYFFRIIEPLTSRCSKFRFKPLDSNILKTRLKDICEKEEIKYEDQVCKLNGMFLTAEILTILC